MTQYLDALIRHLATANDTEVRLTIMSLILVVVFLIFPLVVGLWVIIYHLLTWRGL